MNKIEVKLIIDPELVEDQPWTVKEVQEYLVQKVLNIGPLGCVTTHVLVDEQPEKMEPYQAFLFGQLVGALHSMQDGKEIRFEHTEEGNMKPVLRIIHGNEEYRIEVKKVGTRTTQRVQV